MWVPLRPVPPTKTRLGRLRRSSASIVDVDQRVDRSSRRSKVRRSSGAQRAPVGLEPRERLRVERLDPLRLGAPRPGDASARRWPPRGSSGCGSSAGCALSASSPRKRNIGRSAARAWRIRSSSSRLIVSSRSGGIAAGALLDRRIRSSHHSIPWSRVRGAIRPRVWATREADASRPSRTTWMKRASGKSRCRVAAWATLSVLCSTRPAASRRRGSRAGRRRALRQAASRSSAWPASKRSTAASKRSRSTNRYMPRIRLV